MTRVVTRIADGLGNQLFQYAAGLAVAHRTGLPLDLDVTWFKKVPRGETPRRLSVTEIIGPEGYRKVLIYGFPERLKNWQTAMKNGSTTSVYQFSLPVEQFLGLQMDTYRYLDSACYVTGCPFNYRLFEDVAPEIVERLLTGLARFTPVLLRPQSYAFVHVRRDDLASRQGYRDRFGLLPTEYYRSSMEAYENEFGPTRWIVCSDDADAAMKVLPSVFDLTPSPGRSEIEDLAVMANAAAGVIANSTFSFWVGILCESTCGRVFAPKPWRRDGRAGVPLPQGWVKVGYELA